MIKPSDIDRLLIEMECTRVIVDYAQRLDAGDFDALASLFHETALFARPSDPDNALIGRDVILEQFRSRPRRQARHVVSNILIDVQDSDRARASSVITLYTGATENHLELEKVLIGTFHDILVRVEEGWQFLERRGGILFGGSYR